MSSSVANEPQTEPARRAVNPLWRLVRLPGRVASWLLIALVRLYQVTLSPLFGPACRFEPTCSRYMIGALQKYGFVRGVWKGLGRILRCHPFHPGGFDPP